MKIAITAIDKDLDAEIDPRFVRARYVLILDPEGSIVEIIDNEANRAESQRAGNIAVMMLSERQVSVLLTGKCGPKALTALGACGIEVWEVQSGTIRQALERFKRDEVSHGREDGPNSATRPPEVLGASGLGDSRGMSMGRGEQSAEDEVNEPSCRLGSLTASAPERRSGAIRLAAFRAYAPRWGHSMRRKGLPDLARARRRGTWTRWITFEI